MRTVAVANVWIGAALWLLAACEGPAGSPGATGATGAAGPQGPAGSAAGGLTAACLQPCHTLQGIVGQYQTSTHYAVYVNNLGGEEVATWTAPGLPCGNCHAVDAHQQRAQGNVVTKGGGAVTNLAKGELNYLNPSNQKSAEAAYGGAAQVAQVYCTTCHKVIADPHVTGAVYVSGAFAFYASTGAGDEVYIEKSSTPGTVTGRSAGKLGTGNVCAWCHKARPDVINYIAAQTTLSSPYWGPHEGPQSDIFSGGGGYHFVDKTYTSTHLHQQLGNGCVGCHMPALSSNHDYPNHSFYAQRAVCTGCHSGVTSFDVNGQQTVVQKGLAELQLALNTAGYLTRGTTAAEQSTPLSRDQLADSQFALDRVLTATPPKVVSADIAGAIWNYLLVARGGARGVHEPPYTKQLLWDSIQLVTGATPTFITARP